MLVRKTLASLGIVMAVVAASMFVSMSAAEGSTTTDFQAQAKALGLTVTQTVELQRRVDGYVKTMHGTQVEVNQVAFPGGTVILALPGATYAQPVHGTTVVPAVTSPCPARNFCAWKGANYTNDAIFWFTCGTYGMPWGTTGSWHNNQGSTFAAFQDRNHATLPGGGVLPGAHSTSYNWTPVWFVDTCF